MFNISSYLKKFTKDITDIESQKLEVARIIKAHTNIEIPLERMEIKNGTVYVESNPAIKNKIFIFKERILNDINKMFKIGDIK